MPMRKGYPYRGYSRINIRYVNKDISNLKLQWWFVYQGSDSPEISLVGTKCVGTHFRVRTNWRFSNPENSLIWKYWPGTSVRFNESSLYMAVFEQIQIYVASIFGFSKVWTVLRVTIWKLCTWHVGYLWQRTFEFHLGSRHIAYILWFSNFGITFGQSQIWAVLRGANMWVAFDKVWGWVCDLYFIVQRRGSPHLHIFVPSHV